MSYLRYLCLFGLSLPPVVCRRRSCLIYVICVCWHIGVYKHVVFCFCFDFLLLVYPMFQVSLDCSFVIAPSVLSHVLLPSSWFVMFLQISIYLLL